MKKLYGIFVILFAFTMTVSAQIKEETKSMSNGNNNSFSINLPKSDKKEIEKSWAKFLKKYKGKTDKIKKTEEFLSDNAKVENMSDNTVDIYSQVNQEGEDTQITVWYDLGGAYLSSETHPEKVTIARSMLDAFALTVAVSNVEDHLKEEEKSLKKLNGDFKDLKKDKTKLEDDIKKFEKKIEEAKAAIIENETAQKAKEEEIKKQEGMVDKVKMKLKEMN